MMHWDQLREQWRQADTPPMEVTPDEVMREAVRLHRRLRLRDVRESVIALLLLPLAANWTWTAWTASAWARLGFASLLALWLIFVPWHLWWMRRLLSRVQPQQPLKAFLVTQRLALQRQATMLKDAWLWYVAPCTICAIGMHLTLRGATRASLLYVIAVLVVAVCISAINRRAARKTFHPRLMAIDRQLQELAENEPGQSLPNQDDPT